MKSSVLRVRPVIEDRSNSVRNHLEMSVHISVMAGIAYDELVSIYENVFPPAEILSHDLTSSLFRIPMIE